MADHPSVYQRSQIGVEGTAGVQADANRQLRSMMIEFQPQAEIDEFKPSGYKWDALTSLNREWSQARVTGEPTYTEIMYPLSGVLSQGTTTVAGTAAGGTSYQWVFNSNVDSADTFKTFTVERGDADRSDLITHAIFTDFNLNVGRENVEIGGQMLGRLFATGGTLTANPTVLGLVPILPNQFSLYMEDTQAALGTASALTRGFVANWNVSGRHTAIWPINAANTSFATTVEAKGVQSRLELALGADDVGMGLLATMRAGASKFIRLQAVGGTLTGGTALTYKFTLDFSGQVVQAPTTEELNDLYVARWNLAAVYDATWGHAMQVTIVNEQSGY